MDHPDTLPEGTSSEFYSSPNMPVFNRTLSNAGLSVTYKRTPSLKLKNVSINIAAPDIQFEEISHLEINDEFSPSASHDPLLLSSRKINLDELEVIKKRGWSGRKLSRFYEEQNNLIDELLKPAHYREDDEESRLLKLYTAISSGSLSLFSTMFDAFMDLACNGVLLYTNWASSRSKPLKYPIGMTRIETAGIIIFATLMCTLSLQIMIEAGRSFTATTHDLELSLFNILWSNLRRYPAAKLLGQDNFNDVLLNIVGISMAIIASRTKWWVDPIGAIVIALWILYSWIGTAFENVELIIGKSAEPPFLQRLTYLALTHDERIVEVDTCRAYHSGNMLWVEVDIVLPKDMPLQEAHDIGESLQFKLETVQNVERAFVHLDFESQHKPEHNKAK
ncbi:hypothetical protein HK096_007053 [Nowakowskiella sp. JEL0078]|nr:hypothetical protein HK096_007053 [Nowakowskiella sp. JEL0078]